MAQTGERDALHLIGLAYDTAISEGNWTAFLQSLALKTNAHSGMLRMIDYSGRQIGFFDTFGYTPDMQKAYRARFMEIDPYRHGFETLPAGELHTADEWLGGKIRRMGEFYNDYERPAEAEYIAGAVLARNDSFNIHAAIHRNRRAGDFDAETLEFLTRVLPHLVRAVHIRQLLENSSPQQVLAQGALNRLRLGVVIADGQGRLIFANQAAERLIDASRGALSICMRYLRAQEPKDAAMLFRLIFEASATTAGKGTLTGGEMRIRCGGGSFLQLCITPLSRQRFSTEFSAPTACAAVFICHPGNMRLPWQKVAHYYGLTQAEAKLAVRLANGVSLEEAAARQDISIHTARSQLKAVFAKTGCKRQTELIAILLQGVLGICDFEAQEP